MKAIIDFFRRLFGIKDEPVPVFEFPTPKLPEPPPIPKPSDTVALGIDCAHWQKGIKWGEVAASGVKFAIIKAFDGDTGADAELGSHRLGARTAGIIPGFYGFNRFKADPKKQARRMMDLTGGLRSGELCFALDVEWDNSSGGYLKYRDGGEMDDQAADHVYACLLELERLSGTTPWIYTAPGFWTEKFKNPERFSRFPLWLNDFRAKSVNQLRVPKKTWQRPVVWQYGEQPMAGVGGVDLNRFLGTLDELKAMVKK